MHTKVEAAAVPAEAYAAAEAAAGKPVQTSLLAV
jgi:hypothetical protein